MIKNWIWHQKFDAEEATQVNEFYFISNDLEKKEGLFIPVLSGKIFGKQTKRKNKIGFKYK